MRLLLFIFVLTGNISNAQELSADFSYYPKTDFSEVVVKNDTSETGEIFQKIVIEGFDARFPFYLIQPKNNPQNRYVILLHGSGGSKNSWTIPSNELTTKYVKLKDSLLSIGYAVIIPDSKYSGERSYEIDFAHLRSLHTPQNGQKSINLFTTTVKDVRIIMDYLESRTGKTPCTFYAIGYSMGGKMAIQLNSVDNRLKAVVACVPPIGAVRILNKRFGLTGTELDDKLLSVHDLFRYAKIQKAPICLLVGNTDRYYTEQEAKEFFDQITVKGKSLKIYESGHHLPASFIAGAINYIK